MKNKRYVEQIRVSSKGQNARDTPEVQRRELDAWRLRDPGILVERIEYVGTGTVGLKDRADLQRLKVLAEAHAFDELRLYSVSRASRSEDVQDQVEVYSLCQRASAVIRTSNGNVYDPNDQWSFVKWVIDIGAAAADRKQILRNTTLAKANRAQEGGKPAGPTPFGLAYDAKKRAWSLHSENAAVVRQMHSWCGEGVSLLEIVRRLNESSAPSPRGQGWARSTVLRVLRSRVCIGEYVYQIGTVEPCKIPVPACVTMKVWEQTQDALTSRKNRPQRDTYAVEALVRQHAICGVCSRSMHVWVQSNKRKARVYYRCSTIQAGQGCGNRYHRQDQIDTEVWDLLVEQIRERQRLTKMATKKQQARNWQEKTVEYEKRLASIKKDEAQVFRMMSAGLGEEVGQERLQELAHSRVRTRRALDEAKKCIQDEIAAAAAIQTLKDKIAHMASKLDGAMKFEDRRELLLSVVVPLSGGVVIHQDGSFDIKGLLTEAA